MQRNPALLCALAVLLAFPGICPAQSDPAYRANATKPVSPKVQLSFFGADFLLTGLVWPGTDGQGQIATLGGLRLWDDNVKWGQINTAPNTYDWSLLDDWIARAQSQHLDVIYTFGDTPQYIGTIPNPPVKCVMPSAY